jgi:hypothetical protein
VQLSIALAVLTFTISEESQFSVFLKNREKVISASSINFQQSVKEGKSVDFREAELFKRTSKVGLGDAFVYGLLNFLSYIADATMIWKHFTLFILTFLRNSYEC